MKVQRVNGIGRSLVLLCQIGLAFALAACGVPVESTPRAVDDDRLPESLREIPTVETTPDGTGQSLTVWLVDGTRLVDVVHQIDDLPSVGSALVELGVGPSEEDQSHSFRSAIPDAKVIVEGSIAGGTATVELDPSFDQIPQRDQVLAIGQVVLTLTDLRGVGQVRFLLSNSEIAVPLPDGRTAAAPVSADDFRSIISS